MARVRNRRPEWQAEATRETVERRRSMVESAGVKPTLNGHRASVGGYRLPFAHVADLETGLECEFSWEAVARVMARGGAFKS